MVEHCPADEGSTHTPTGLLGLALAMAGQVLVRFSGVRLGSGNKFLRQALHFAQHLQLLAMLPSHMPTAVHYDRVRLGGEVLAEGLLAAAVGVLQMDGNVDAFLLHLAEAVSKHIPFSTLGCAGIWAIVKGVVGACRLADVFICEDFICDIVSHMNF